MEQWKPIPGHPGYHASTEGRIRGPRCIMKPWKRKKNPYGQPYFELELWNGGTFKRIFVHKLVLETFVGPRPEGRHCRHLNGNSLDNRWPENLCWGTARENSDDRIKHRPDYYLSEDEIAATLAKPHLTCRDIAIELGCSKSTISNVRLAAGMRQRAPRVRKKLENPS